MIVTVRLYAIFGGSKFLLRALLVLLAVTTGVSAVIIVIEYEGATGESDPSWLGVLTGWLAFSLPGMREKGRKEGR
jgi:hypothetical protein